MLSTLLTLFAANTAQADDFTMPYGDQSQIEIIGWSADENTFAVRVVEKRSPKFTSPMRLPTEPCDGYKGPDGMPLNGGVTIKVLDTKLIPKTQWPIMDANKCTFPEEIPTRQQNADTGMAGMGITPSAAKKLPINGTSAMDGQYFELHNERFKFVGEKLENAGDVKARDLKNQLLFRKGMFDYPMNVRCKPDPGLRDPPPAEPKWFLEQVVVSPSTNKFVMFARVQCPFDRDVVIPFAVVEKTSDIDHPWVRIK